MIRTAVQSVGKDLLSQANQGDRYKLTDLLSLHESSRDSFGVDLVFFRPFEFDLASRATREQCRDQFKVGSELRESLAAISRVSFLTFATTCEASRGKAYIVESSSIVYSPFSGLARFLAERSTVHETILSRFFDYFARSSVGRLHSQAMSVFAWPILHGESERKCKETRERKKTHL